MVHRSVPIACSFAWLLSLALVLWACTGGPPGTAFCEESAQVVFDPAGELLVPFPSDLYLQRDATTATGFRIRLNEENLPPGENLFEAYPFLSGQLSALDGFGTSAAILFAFTEEIGERVSAGDGEEIRPPQSLALDPALTSQPGSPVVLVDISIDSPRRGMASPLLLEYLSDRDQSDRGQYFLLAEPAFPLRPKTTYAIALTRSLTDAAGRCVAPSIATRRLLTTSRPEQEFGLLGERRDEALRVLEEGGFIESNGDLTALSIFTTQSIEDELVTATADILARAAVSPPQIVPGSLQVAPDTDGVAIEVSGRVALDTYRSADGTFVIVDGAPQVQGQEEVTFELLIPETTAEHAPPFPIIIYQHGLLGQRGQDRGAKRAQARAGFASLSIDAVLHGDRAAASGWEVTNFFAIELDTGAFNMPVLRDNFRQTYLDLVQLAELVPALAELDLLPVDTPDGQAEIAAAPLYLSGHSLGAIIAAGAIGLSPRIPAANLCAGGGSLPTNLFMRSDLLGTFIDLLKPPGTSDADVRKFMPLLQLLVERGDPVNLVRLATAEPPAAIGGMAPKHVLFQEVIDDAIVPNEANEALARALGQAHLRPLRRTVFGLNPIDEPASGNHPTGASALFFQFDIQVDGSPADHTEVYADPLAQTQWIHFFDSHRSSGVAEAIDPYRVLGVEHP